MGLLWGAEKKPRRGPKPSLSIEEIVGEAVRVADGGGLGALSMARVAEGLGVTTMALYRYVPGKGDLVELMSDRVAGEALALGVRGSDAGSGGYRERLAVLARRIFAINNLHPWMLEVPIGGPPLGPNSLAWLESALDALAEAGVGGGEAVGVALLLSGYVRGAAEVSVGIARAGRRTSATPDQLGAAYARLFEEVAADGRYPRLADVLDSGVFGERDEAPDEDFEFGLERVLDGIDVYVRRRPDA